MLRRLSALLPPRLGSLPLLPFLAPYYEFLLIILTLLIRLLIFVVLIRRNICSWVAEGNPDLIRRL